jgi:hypothetical protein
MNTNDSNSAKYGELYRRCQCGKHGFTPEIWAMFGPEIYTPSGEHSVSVCREVVMLPDELSARCKVAAGTLTTYNGN